MVARLPASREVPGSNRAIRTWDLSRRIVSQQFRPGVRSLAVLWSVYKSSEAEIFQLGLLKSSLEANLFQFRSHPFSVRTTRLFWVLGSYTLQRMLKYFKTRETVFTYFSIDPLCEILRVNVLFSLVILNGKKHVSK